MSYEWRAGVCLRTTVMISWIVCRAHPNSEEKRKKKEKKKKQSQSGGGGGGEVKKTSAESK